MDLSKTEAQISQKKEQIQVIEKQLSEKQADLEAKKKAYSEGLIKGADRSRQLPSLDTQKKSVIEAQAEFEALEGARDILQGELAELEKQKGFAELSRTQGERFRQSMASCETTSAELGKLLIDLERNLKNFISCTVKIIKSGQEATSGFFIVSTDLPPDISLKHFLAGEVKEVDPGEGENRAAITEEVKARILSLSEFQSPVERIQGLLEPFSFSVEDLRKWRHFCAKRSEKNCRHAFVPKQRRVFVVDGETARAHSELTKAREKKEAKAAELKEKKQRLAVG